MKTILKLLVCIFCIGAVLVWMGMQQVATYLKQEIPSYLNTLETDVMQISVGEIRRDNCVFQACLNLKNIRVDVIGQNSLIIPDMQITVPPVWPPRVNIVVPQTDIGGGRLTLSEKLWIVHTGQINWNGSQFFIQGQVDRINETGEVIVQAEGLKRLVQKIPGVPNFVLLFLKNKPMTLSLKPEKGFLRWQGIPLIPIR